MTKEGRDRIIVEAIGGCWHEWEDSKKESNRLTCKKCGSRAWPGVAADLSTPTGFFWWWPKAQKMEWWPEFCEKVLATWDNLFFIINPDRGAWALAEFLDGRKK